MLICHDYVVSMLHYVVVISLVLLIFTLQAVNIGLRGSCVRDGLGADDLVNREIEGRRCLQYATIEGAMGHRLEGIQGEILGVPVNVVVSVTIASLAISSSGSSAAESADKPDEGKVSVTLSSDDVQASYERAEGRILRSGYRYKDLHFSIDNNCVANSYGKVQEFFRSNPCKWLARAYVVVQKKGGEGEMYC